jgi:hypothetical protein
VLPFVFRYGKFRKSKNLSTYGDKALSEILGRKASDAPAASDGSAGAGAGTGTGSGSEIKSAAEITSDIQTTTSSMSMKDYFAKALQSCMHTECKRGTGVLIGF